VNAWEREYTGEVLSAAEFNRLRSIYEPLAESVRALVDATIRTTEDAETLAAVKKDIDAAVQRLRRNQIDGTSGETPIDNGSTVSWGNAVRGIRNAVAPPVFSHLDESGRVTADFHLGAAYEGPPGHVHGGVSAMILDQMLGEAACPDRIPRFSGSITYKYVRPAALGTLHAEAFRTHTDGAKTYCSAYIADTDGAILVEAEGVFIMPRWLRN
jgi:acyl-coenzyme A thioesterase PaaI-like protein